VSAGQGHRASHIATVGELDRPAFVARFGGVFEASPWIADAAWAEGPFADVDALHAALVAVVDAAPREQRLALIRAHPDLAGKAAIAGDLTPESTAEQASAGLDRLTPGQFARVTELNDAYRERFGFPFVICARDHDADAIIAAMERRVAHDPDTEEQTALAQIARIARLRLEDLVA
jgi:2-oxo-4-hydroxy-4-carboxy-5-ureidoimidazoline decarboxylase